MIEYDFYDYYYPQDKINIYSEDAQNYFENNYSIIIDSIDFDENQNVILYIEDLLDELKSENKKAEIEKGLLEKFEHLNDVQIRNMKIILTFDCKEIVLF